MLELQETHVALTTIDAPIPANMPTDVLYKLKHLEGTQPNSIDILMLLGETVNTMEDNLDVRAFFECWPTGSFGMQHIRTKPLSDTKFIHWMMRNREPRFRQNRELKIFLTNRQVNLVSIK